jgi:hypothetical protein
MLFRRSRMVLVSVDRSDGLRWGGMCIHIHCSSVNDHFALGKRAR